MLHNTERAYWLITTVLEYIVVDQLAYTAIPRTMLLLVWLKHSIQPLTF